MTLREDPIEELLRRDVRAIVMGGSAGSIDALRVLLPALPVALDIPVIIALHLGPVTTHSWTSVFPTTLRCQAPCGP